MKRKYKLISPTTGKAPVLFIAAFAVLLSLLFFGPAYAYPVPELPDDNLIVNPWFRDLSNQTAPGFDGWVRPLNQGVTWGPSQKESNPSPDIVVSGTCGFQPVYCGTAARWAEQAGILYPYIDVYAYQVVATDPSHRKLTFFTYYVSHIVEVGAVNIYGSQSAQGPWTLLWTPLYHSETDLIIPESGEVRDLWEETGFLEWTIEEGYPYYKIEIHSRLPESPIPNGIRGVGFKMTGVYFSTDATDAPGGPAPTPGSGGAPTATAAPAEATPAVTATASPDAVATADNTDSAPATPTDAPAAASTREAEAEVDAEAEAVNPGGAALSAWAASPTEIFLAWDKSQNNGRGLRLERSLNVASGWQSIAAIEPGVVEYIDSGLAPDTVYYYRLRASQDTVSPVFSAATLSLPEPPLAAPTALRAISPSPLRVELRWEDRSDNEDGFVVERSLDGLSFTPIVTLGQNATAFVDSGLGSAIYYYRARSFLGDTYSDYSGVASVEVSDRRADEVAAVATASAPDHLGDSDQTGGLESAEQPGAATTPAQNSWLFLAVALVALTVGIGLGILLIRLRPKA